MTGTQIFFFSYELANTTVTIQGFWNIFDWADRYTGHFIFNHKDTMRFFDMLTPITQFLFFLYYTFGLCIIIVILYLMYFIH